MAVQSSRRSLESFSREICGFGPSLNIGFSFPTRVRSLPRPFVINGFRELGSLRSSRNSTAHSWELHPFQFSRDEGWMSGMRKVSNGMLVYISSIYYLHALFLSLFFKYSWTAAIFWSQYIITSNVMIYCIFLFRKSYCHFYFATFHVSKNKKQLYE